MLTESFFVAPVCRRNETGMRIDMLVRTPTREGEGNKNDTISKLEALKAFYYLETGDTTNALISEKKYLTIAQNNPLGLFFMANYYYRYIGDSSYINKSEKILKKAYKLDSDDYSIVGLLAEMMYKSKDYDSAIIYIDKAIKLYTKNGMSSGKFEQLKEVIKTKK